MASLVLFWWALRIWWVWQVWLYHCIHKIFFYIKQTCHTHKVPQNWKITLPLPKSHKNWSEFGKYCASSHWLPFPHHSFPPKHNNLGIIFKRNCSLFCNFQSLWTSGCYCRHDCICLFYIRCKNTFLTDWAVQSWLSFSLKLISGNFQDCVIWLKVLLDSFQHSEKASLNIFHEFFKAKMCLALWNKKQKRYLSPSTIKPL